MLDFEPPTVQSAAREAKSYASFEEMAEANHERLESMRITPRDNDIEEADFEMLEDGVAAQNQENDDRPDTRANAG